ncbi:MAG: DUF433 domain-containing protein [Rubrobacteraceae bacterium]|nr:DUF433 domain-containing protein [Rubrobacteraceae bacterium]
MSERGKTLMALGEGVYTVPKIERILQPNMSQCKVRRWLHKGLLGEPIRWGSTGRPHLLSFQQLLKVRTIQELREGGLPLQRITPAIRLLSSRLFERLFDEEWHELTLFSTGAGRLGVMDDRGEVAVELETGQHILPETLSELSGYLSKTRKDWDRREIDLERFPQLVSNAGIVAGSPTVKGTRIETSVVAYLAEALGVDKALELYPHLSREAVLQAMSFEGAKPLAA